MFGEWWGQSIGIVRQHKKIHAFSRSFLNFISLLTLPLLETGGAKFVVCFVKKTGWFKSEKLYIVIDIDIILCNGGGSRESERDWKGERGHGGGDGHSREEQKQPYYNISQQNWGVIFHLLMFKCNGFLVIWPIFGSIAFGFLVFGHWNRRYDMVFLYQCFALQIFPQFSWSILDLFSLFIG